MFKRLIARLDVKAPNLIKGVHLEGLRKLGDPKEFAIRYYQEGIDEILYMDTVASLYDRNTIHELVKHTAEEIFIPITVAGGVRSIDDARKLLRAGADKVALNSAAIKRPELITELAEYFGSQCIVLSVEAKMRKSEEWEAYYDNGRERSGKDAIAWCCQGVEMGAGEVLVTSVDREGSGTGFDIELIRAISDSVSVPVIASGGYGSGGHLKALFRETDADGMAVARALHYGETSVPELRDYAIGSSVLVRRVAVT